jgi:membrane-associated protease RseP (regulator of RpoE activity)
MRAHGILLALMALAPLVPAGASAQDPVTIFATAASRGILGFSSEPVQGADPEERVIVNVSPGSPAAEAGLAKGDTLLRINGAAASPEVMRTRFEPGDTVVLRIRRDGRERDLTVVAAERSRHFRYAFPDSIDRRFSVYMDRMRAGVDTLHDFPSITVHRFGQDSSTTIIIGTDTMHVSHVPFMSLHRDSLSRFYQRVLPGMIRDSAAIRFFTPGEGGRFEFFADSSFARGFDIMAGSALFGMRAVAGAELAPLSPELAEYFGATDGVLVLNAAERTPAERAGLRGGDVIVRAGDTPVRSIADLRRAIELARGQEITLRVLRHGRNIDITLGR